MKAKEIRNKTEVEIKKDMMQIRKELFNIRFQRVSTGMENTSRIVLLRRDIARLKTILTEKSKSLR